MTYSYKQQKCISSNSDKMREGSGSGNAPSHLHLCVCGGCIYMLVHALLCVSVGMGMPQEARGAQRAAWIVSPHPSTLSESF